jgi:hypothetical protein
MLPEWSRQLWQATACFATENPGRHTVPLGVQNLRKWKLRLVQSNLPFHLAYFGLAGICIGLVLSGQMGKMETIK